MRHVEGLMALALFVSATTVHAQSQAAPPEAAAAKTIDTSGAAAEELTRHDQLMQAGAAIKAGHGVDALPILDKVIAQ